TEEALHGHIEAAVGRFRGIRHMATWDGSPLIKPTRPDPGEHLLLDPAFRDGIRSLQRLGLAFEAWVYFPQLHEVADLARAFPDMSIIVNHFGGPIVLGPYSDRTEVLARCRDGLRTLIGCPNVTLKLGGVGMPLFGLGWHKREVAPEAEEVAAAWRDTVRWCIESFGVERTMFESNFPVDRFSMSYRTVWDAFDLMTADLSVSERGHLFHDTAVRTYHLRRHDDPLDHSDKEC
ncbi:MAG: hypothetical protein RLZZ623_142, partial [Actinomycetota bacterium]